MKDQRKKCNVQELKVYLNQISTKKLLNKIFSVFNIDNNKHYRNKEEQILKKFITEMSSNKKNSVLIKNLEDIEFLLEFMNGVSASIVPKFKTSMFVSNKLGLYFTQEEKEIIDELCLLTDKIIYEY